MRISLRLKQEHLVIDVRGDLDAYRVDVEGRESRAEICTVDRTSIVLVVDGHRHQVDVVHDGRDRLVAVGGEVYRFTPEDGTQTSHAVDTVAIPEVAAPMPGKVTQMLVKVGDHVNAGDGLLILEAMKMENRLVAEAAGIVTEVRVADGDMVDGGQVLIMLQYADISSA